MPPELLPIRPQSQRAKTPQTQPSIAAEKLLTQREVSQLMNVSVRSVYTLAESGVLKRVKIGRTVRFDMADVRDAIEKLKG